MYKVVLSPCYSDVAEKAMHLRNALGIPFKDANDLVTLGGIVMKTHTEHAAVTVRDKLITIGLPASIQMAGSV